MNDLPGWKLSKRDVNAVFSSLHLLLRQNQSRKLCLDQTKGMSCVVPVNVT